MRSCLLIVDGNNLGYRAYKRTELSHEGQGTEVIYIGLRSLVRVVKKFMPQSLIVAWDGGHDPSRKARFPGYKDKGVLTPEGLEEKKEFFRQLAGLTKVFNGLGITQVCLPNREADDVIATIVGDTSIVSSVEFEEVIIASTDKDYFQILDNERLRVYSPITDELWDREQAELKFGFSVEGYSFWKAIVGGHDKIPGIDGLGGVSATFLTRSKFLGGNEEPTNARERNALILFEEHKDNVILWTELSTFIDIPREEILANMKVPEKLAYYDRLRTAVSVLDEYGIQEIKEELSQFIKLFGR